MGELDKATGKRAAEVEHKMEGQNPEPWRRTGRKAQPEQLLGLSQGVLLEALLYHDDGTRQGQGIIELLDGGDHTDENHGVIHTGRFHAIEDGYYKWWIEDRFKGRPVPLHFLQQASVSM